MPTILTIASMENLKNQVKSPAHEISQSSLITEKEIILFKQHSSDYLPAISPQSAVNLDIKSPVFVLSKKACSCLKMEANVSILTLLTIFSFAYPNKNILHSER